MRSAHGVGESCTALWKRIRSLHEEGLPAQRVELIRDNQLVTFSANQRYADYLKIAPTGSFGNIELPAGKTPAATLLAEPYVEIVQFSWFNPDTITGHEIWNIWFPYRSWRVNKWFRCRCGVIGLTGSDVSSRGIATDVPLGRLVNLADDPTAKPLLVETAVPYGEQVPVWDASGALIGYETLVPADADLSSPGLGAELEEWIAEMAAEWPPEIAALVLAELYRDKELLAFIAGQKLPNAQNAP